MKRLLCIFLLVSTSLAATAAPFYTVQPGDSLSKIAKHHLSGAAQWKTLAELNGLNAPYLIFPGQQIDLGTALRTPAPRKVLPTATSILPAEFTVVGIDGRARVLREKEYHPVIPPSKIFPGSTLSLDSDARGVLSASLGERVVAHGAWMALVESSMGDDFTRRVALRLDTGTLQIHIPETPAEFIFRVSSPSGEFLFQSGEYTLQALSPARTVLSVHQGTASVSLPRGDFEFGPGHTVLIHALRDHPTAVTSPEPPTLAVETVPYSAIVAVASRPGARIHFEVFSDGDFHGRVRHVLRETDGIGIVSHRFSLPEGKYWLAASTISENGIRGKATTRGPFVVTSNFK